MKSLLSKINEMGSSKGMNIVAFSGGVDSSLVAAALHIVFPSSTLAITGVSPSLSQIQLEKAREIAKSIGVKHLEIPTMEGEIDGYIENNGQACFHCKSTLYESMNAIVKKAKEIDGNVLLFNGTNKDDKLDPTRVGLIAAQNWKVLSPLETYTKKEVREMAKEIHLSNWNMAASPCLRSRIAFGVEATEEHLVRIEKAEEIIRSYIALQTFNNMRVRLLAKGKGVIELEKEIINGHVNKWDLVKKELLKLGFLDIEIRPFKSGSLSGYEQKIN